MDKIIQTPQEYGALVEIFDVLNECHHFHYSRSIQEQALLQCENLGLIDIIIHRIGHQVKIPTRLIRHVLFETMGDVWAPVVLGDFLMEYWSKYWVKRGNSREVFSSKESLLIREFFIYFLTFKQLEGDLCVFEFESPLKEEVLRCT